MVKDKYSRKLFCYLLKDKKELEVFKTIKNFIN